MFSAVAAKSGAPRQRGDDRVDGFGQRRQVTVVDLPDLDVSGQLDQRARPCGAFRQGRNFHLFDHGDRHLRLAAARKQKGLTQQALADHVGIYVTQIRRYEAGTSQPTLDALRSLNVALTVSTDALVFGDTERGPNDPGFAVHLEALNRLDEDEKTTILNLIESVLLRHEARRLARTS
jgi:transcriptional regulator with XRE-family HTH domain